MDMIWRSSQFFASGVTGIESMRDGKHYTTLAETDAAQYLIKYRYSDGQEVDTLLRTSELPKVNGTSMTFSSYSFNADETKLLLATEEESIYRHSSKAHYYAFDLSSKECKPITNLAYGKQSLASFSPTANQVAFVRDNDLHMADLNFGQERRITGDGKQNQIINGAVD